MREIILENLCRLCLSDCFPCSNIFIDCSSTGHVISEVLSFVYNLDASQDDGLPATICRPCLWKLIEFETYKRNVHNTKTELRDLVMKLVCQNRANQRVEVSETTRIDSEETWNLLQKHKNSDDDDDDDVCDSEDIQCTSLANEVYIKEERVEFENEIDEIHHPNVAELTLVSSKNPKNQNSNYPMRKTLDSQFIGKETQEANEIFSSMSNSNSESEFSEEAEPILPNNLCEVESVAELKSPEMLSVGDAVVKDFKGKRKNYEGLPFPNLNIPFRDKENIYVCNICDESFKLKEELTRHVIFHYNDKPYPSRISDGYYKRNYEMNQNWHRQLKEGVSLIKRSWAKNHCKEIFMCETCGKEYDDKKKLDMHSVRHTNKFSCSFCGKCFGGNRERERHVRIHTQEKPFHCSVCEKSFNRKDNLHTHMATHSEQWPSSVRRNTKKLRKST